MKYVSVKYGTVGDLGLFIPIRLIIQFVYEVFIMKGSFVQSQVIGLTLLITSLVLFAGYKPAKKQPYEIVGQVELISNLK